MKRPRNEYPRPQFRRKHWLNLNGTWSFTYDDQNIGLKEGWFTNPEFNQEIVVPFPYQAKLSGIGEKEFHDIVWYSRKFRVPKSWQEKRIILHFGAVDYRAWVWVNGSFACFHEGGHTPFKADITDLLVAGENKLVVRVEDISTDLAQPRGKQYWKEESEGIFYTRTTGIWQTVWLEPVSDIYLERVKLTPDIEKKTLEVEYFPNNWVAGLFLKYQVKLAGEMVSSGTVTIPEKEKDRKFTVKIDNPELWSPDKPVLYDLKIILCRENSIYDEIDSYFGMRKISVEDGTIKLNNRPYYMKLVLDQGYFPEGILTAPTDDDLKRDIELAKAMGFNGARKHQKIEDPRYLYWADRLGFLVWGEMANCHTYTEEGVQRVTTEWQVAVKRDYSHPSVVVWVPLNESWGVQGMKDDYRPVAHSLSLYYLTKALDPTRPVIANDGWELTRTDLCSIHDYEGKKAILKERYGSLENTLKFKPSERHLFIPGFEYQNQPIFISEFGGIAYRKSKEKGWGYTEAKNREDFLKRYYDVVSALVESYLVQGFCYTQLYDVEQEVNGLLTYDRRPKVDPNLIKAINDGADFEEIKKMLGG